MIAGKPCSRGVAAEGDSRPETGRASETPRALSGRDSDRCCRRCGAAAVADENRCRDCGSFLPGNQSGLVHGGRRRTQSDPEETELYQSWVADLGGVEELTAGQRAVLSRAAEADLIAHTAFDFLSRTQDGISSARVQSAIGALSTAAGMTFRAAGLLGLERRERQVSLEDYMEQRAREAGGAS